MQNDSNWPSSRCFSLPPTDVEDGARVNPWCWQIIHRWGPVRHALPSALSFQEELWYAGRRWPPRSPHDLIEWESFRFENSLNAHRFTGCVQRYLEGKVMPTVNRLYLIAFYMACVDSRSDLFFKAKWLNSLVKLKSRWTKRKSGSALLLWADLLFCMLCGDGGKANEIHLVLIHLLIAGDLRLWNTICHRSCLAKQPEIVFSIGWQTWICLVVRSLEKSWLHEWLIQFMAIPFNQSVFGVQLANGWLKIRIGQRRQNLNVSYFLVLFWQVLEASFALLHNHETRSFW